MFKTISLEQIAKFIMGQSPPSRFVEENLNYIPFLQGCAEFGYKYPTPKVSCRYPKKICEKDDVLVSVRAPVGTLNMADKAYCIGRGLAALRYKENVDKNFGWHLLNYWIKGLTTVSQGSTFEAVGKNELSRLTVSDIPFNEQLEIARILDTVDEVIQRTEQLIAKLKAIKQGVLHDLLTRGLDKNGQLRDPLAHPDQFKDSPLGRIPKGWQITSLGKIARIRRGASPRPIDSPEWFANKGVGWVRISDVTKAIYRLTETEQYLSPSGEKKSVRVYPGQIIMSICATIGEPIILGMDACIHDGFVVFDQHEHLADSGFLVRSLRYKQDYFKSQGQTGTQANLNTNIVKDCLIALPPMEEQRAISEIMDYYDNSLNSESKYFNKLKLIKKGLMHDLLTGKVRVNTNKMEQKNEDIDHT